MFANVENKNYFADSKPECAIVENGIILPSKKVLTNTGEAYFKGGVVDEKGNFITASQTLRATKQGSLFEGYEYNSDAVKTTLPEVLYAGLLNNHFGHFLIESTNRLWYWVENRDKNLDIAFLMTKNQPILKQFWEFMEILGIPKNKIHFIKQPTKCNKIYIPSTSNVLGYSYNEKFLTVFQEAATRVPTGKNEKVYLSRTKFRKKHSCFGEQYLEDMFLQNGYTIIYPEQMSLKEQISALNGASEVAGVVGTNTHLEVFSRLGVKSVILNRSDIPISAQSVIHQALNANWYVVGANMNPFPLVHSAGPNLLGITPEVQSFCTAHNMEFNRKYVGYIKASDSRHFVKEYLRTYTQNVYNNEIKTRAPLTAERLLFMQKAFIPLKRLIKQKFKNLRLKHIAE